MAIEPKDIVLNHNYLKKFLINTKVISRDTELKTLSQIFILPTFEDGWGTFKKTYRITEIGDSLFENFENLRMVEIPNTVIRIGAKAFKNCKYLYKIKINENLKQIDSEAFANCTGFNDKSKVLNIPSSVGMIASNAFQNVPYINFDGEIDGKKSGWGEKVNLAEVKKQGQSEIEKKEQVAFEKQGQVAFEKQGQVAVEKQGQAEVERQRQAETERQRQAEAERQRQADEEARRKFGERKKAGEIRMVEEKDIRLNDVWLNAICDLRPEEKLHKDVFNNIPSTYEANNTIYHIVGIANGLFENCEVLKKVILPDSITIIGQNAFKNCFDLEDINFPKSLKTIESNAFDGCFSLSTVYEPFVIPSTVEEIGQDAFKDVEYIQYEGKATGAPWGAKKFSAKAKTEEEQIAKVEENQSKFDESMFVSFLDKLGNLIDSKIENGIFAYKEFAENQEIRKLETKNLSLQQEIKDKDDKLQANNITIESLKIKIQGFENLKASLKQQFEENKRKEVEKINKNIEAKDKELKEANDKVTALQVDNKTLFEQNKVLTENNRILGEKNSDKKQKITELESQIDQLKESHADELAKKEKEIEEALEEARKNAGLSAEETERKVADITAEKQNAENALKAHELLYADFDDLYECYNQLSENVKTPLQNLFGKEDKILSIVFNITKSRNIESLWQFICDRIDRDELPDQIDNLKKIFDIAFRLLQLADSNYVLLEPNLGDTIDNVKMKRYSKSPAVGSVKEVLLKGIKFQANNRIIKPSLVVLG